MSPSLLLCSVSLSRQILLGARPATSDAAPCLCATRDRLWPPGPPGPPGPLTLYPKGLLRAFLPCKREGRPGEESGASPFPPPTAQIRSSLRPPPHTAVPSVCAHCPGLCPACGTLLWALIRFLKPASPPLLDCKTVEGRGLLFLLFILNHSYYPSGQVITMCGTQNRENVSVSNETSVVERKTTFKIDVLNVTVQPPKPQLDPKPTVVQRRPLGSHWHAGRPPKLLRP